MSKGLEALNELKQSCETHMGTTVYILQEDKFETIEKELKDFECLDNFFQKIKTKYGIDDLDYLGHICSQYEALKKKEKALEIIKRTAMKLVSLEDDTTICKKGRYAFYDSELYQSVDLTQEEYDLLKEVLL